MQDKAIHILSTKELSHDLIELAEEKNIVIDCIPFIQVKPIVSDVVRDKVLPISGKEIAVVFTSFHGAHAVSGLNVDCTHWQIYCLSGATKKAAEECFLKAIIKATAENATALAHKIIEDKTQEVYFFCGNARREELPNLLHENKIEVHEVNVYQTHITSTELHKTYDGIIFFSPSGVESFLLENKIPEKALLLAIGQTTAASLSQFPQQLIISEKPDPKILIQKIISHFRG